MHIDQIALITAITSEISAQHPGVDSEPRYFNAIIKAANIICDEFKKPTVKASNGMGLRAWLASHDTGMSSLYMASVLSGEACSSGFAFPWDPSDLGRCIRLVDAVPEMEGFINKMLSHGPEWTAVVNNWDAWKKLYHAEDGENLYREMKAAYASARPEGEK
ncbi:MAG TPA: hypothetical protein DIT05_09425 [Morganella sp. (in: Bacteria)]|nr:hypothetical protein [Morganella sp. (in: enterobacteria)]